MKVIIIAGILVLIAYLVLLILDRLNITRIFMKGRPAGILGNAMRAAQDALEPQASKAHEYMIEEQEKEDEAQDKDQV
jgi:hypothetical protein